MLQQHVLFWDRDNDGVIWPWNTYTGFRDLGFNILFSLFAVLVINLNFSYPTRLAHSYLPDPFFGVYVSSIHKAKVWLGTDWMKSSCVELTPLHSTVRTRAPTTTKGVSCRSRSKICSRNGTTTTTAP